jgi:hypothetical protein
MSRPGGDPCVEAPPPGAPRPGKPGACGHRHALRLGNQTPFLILRRSPPRRRASKDARPRRTCTPGRRLIPIHSPSHTSLCGKEGRPPHPLIPAHAGIQFFQRHASKVRKLYARVRGHERNLTGGRPTPNESQPPISSIPRTRMSGSHGPAEDLLPRYPESAVARSAAVDSAPASPLPAGRSRPPTHTLARTKPGRLSCVPSPRRGEGQGEGAPDRGSRDSTFPPSVRLNIRCLSFHGLRLSPLTLTLSPPGRGDENRSADPESKPPERVVRAAAKTWAMRRPRPAIAESYQSRRTLPSRSDSASPMSRPQPQ